MAKIRILSIDGGGLMGIIPIKILQLIESITQSPIHESFDLIAGTSTGGLIATGLSVTENGYSPKVGLDTLEDFYLNRSQTIFPTAHGLEKVWRTVKSVFRPTFSTKAMERELKAFYGDLSLKDCLTPLLVPVYNVSGNYPLLLSTRIAEENASKNVSVFDACRATTAAPTYLPPHLFRYDDEVILGTDGGLFANNPSIAAFIEATDHRSYYEHRKTTERAFPAFESITDLLDDIFVLSIGTGHYYNQHKAAQAPKWGMLQWIRPVIRMMMDGSNNLANKQAQALLPSRNYLRLDCEFNRPIDFLDSSKENLDYLQKIVAQQLTENKSVVKTLDYFLENAGLLQLQK
ncbi:MAG: patatin-like phospholipase family protein [Chitinophagales bacterium]